MNRPCGCDSCVIGEPLHPQRDCRLCWLYHNHPGYRRLWTQARGTMREAERGPGTQLKLLLQELGVTSFAGCGCDDKVSQMNRWGVEGCRENFDTIRGWIADAQAKASWSTKIAATIAAASTGIAREINPVDIAGSLVRIAIERTELLLVTVGAR